MEIGAREAVQVLLHAVVITAFAAQLYKMPTLRFDPIAAVLIARRLTEIPGSSAYFMEGAVTYSNDAKMRTLNVSPDILEKHGAVSAECAEAMAAGLRKYAGTDHAISVTGIAGPDGGSDEKPVGTVFIGYAGEKGVKSVKIVLPGDRYLIRWRSSQAALDYLRRQLKRS